MRRLLVLAFIWGWSFLFIKVAVEGMTPTTVAAARITLGALVLHVVLRHQGARLPTDVTTWRHFAVTAAFGSVVPFSLLAWGEERITSALTSVLNASTPLFTALAAAVVLGERLRRGQAVGLVLGVVGVAIAAGVGSSDIGASSLAGGGAAVAAGACYGVGFTYMKRHLMGIPPVVAACGQLTVGAVVLAPVAAATSWREGIQLAPHRVLAIVLLGVLGTGLAYVLNYRVVADMGSTKASLVTYLVPVVAVTVGVAVLGEPFRMRIVAGGLLIVAGITLVHRRLRPWVRRPRLPAGAGVNAAVAAVGMTALLASCGGDDATPASPTTSEEQAAADGCGPAVEEPFDPSSSVHVLAGAPEPDYLTDPPTSGPHLTGATPEGVLDEPLSRPAQVLLLEQGGVLVQHRGLDAERRASLEALAGPDVVVAPNPDLPAPVVATAWLHKLTCDTADLDALRAFVDRHAGKGPEH